MGSVARWPRGPVLAAGVLAAFVAIGIALWLALSHAGGVTIERATEAATEATAGATTEAEASTGEASQTGSEDSLAEDSEVTGTAASAGDATTILVHVDGAVAAPGVYELSCASPRVIDAVAAAGGLAEGADISQVNLAAVIADADKVHIPYEGEQATDASASSAGASSGTSANAAAASSSALVNINTATAEELDTLPGVGAATAAAIISDREQNGAFTSPEDLMRVSGIGEKKYAKLEGLICV